MTDQELKLYSFYKKIQIKQLFFISVHVKHLNKDILLFNSCYESAIKLQINKITRFV